MEAVRLYCLEVSLQLNKLVLDQFLLSVKLRLINFFVDTDGKCDNSLTNKRISPSSSKKGVLIKLFLKQGPRLLKRKRQTSFLTCQPVPEELESTCSHGLALFNFLQKICEADNIVVWINNCNQQISIMAWNGLNNQTINNVKERHYSTNWNIDI